MTVRPITVPVSGSIARATSTLFFYEGNPGANETSVTEVTADSTDYLADIE